MLIIEVLALKEHQKESKFQSMSYKYELELQLLISSESSDALTPFIF